MKRYIIFVISILILVLMFFSSRENTISDNINVTVSIDCSSILLNKEKLDASLKNSKYIPFDGIILEKTSFTLKEGSTVLDALKHITKERGIQLEYSQSINDVYVEGINYIYEYSCGELSGWMYKVNGSFAQKGCDKYVLNDNDLVEWVYTCNLGQDVGESFK